MVSDLPNHPAIGSSAEVHAGSARAVGATTMSAEILESILTCPHCGFAKREPMATDACQFFYECTNCKTLLRPEPGDCCVFCSFGSVKCPPRQQQSVCCG
jgi:hypothetical protein